MENNFACCGLNCAECPVYVATATNNDTLRQKTATEWSKLYANFLQAPLKLSDMNCKGCHSNTLFVGCAVCPMRKCCYEKGLSTCGDCAEYTSCGMLNSFYSRNHQKAKENLDLKRVIH